MKLYANYAYLETDTNNFLERSLQARNTGALYVYYVFSDDVHMSLAYFLNREINEESFDG